jgi:hypothetical protein
VERLLPPLLLLLSSACMITLDWPDIVPGTDVSTMSDDDAWFHETWSTGDKSYRSNGIRWTSSSSSTADKAPRVTAVNPTTGRSHSLQFEFQGNRDPADDAWSEQRFALGNRPAELHICWDIFVPGPADRDKATAPFVQRKPKGPGNNKLLRLWDDDYRNRHVGAGLSFQPKTSRPGDAEIIVEYFYRRADGSLQSKANVGPWTVIFHDGTRGRWNRIGFHVRLASTSSSNDGRIELRMNGETLARYEDLPLRSSAPNAKNYFANGYLLGWANSGYDETTRFWIGDVIIGPERPDGC